MYVFLMTLKSAKKWVIDIPGNKSFALIAVARLYVDLWGNGAPAAAPAERPHKLSTADV